MKIKDILKNIIFIKRKDIFENFILGAIILVIFQTFLDEYSRYANMRISLRNFLIFTNVLFDIIFSLEFIYRTIWASRDKKFKIYFFYNRGWVDFLSSIPLLLLNSLPTLYFFLKGDLTGAVSSIAIMNVLKTVKAIRVTRILRLIRLLKIFGKIHNADSKMAQRHTQTIATTGVFSIIMLLLILSFFKFNKLNTLAENREAHYYGIIKNIENISKTMKIPAKQLTRKMLSSDKNILMLHYGEFMVFSNVEKTKFKKYYGYEDYINIEQNEYKALVSLLDINKVTAGINLQNFLIIVCLILCYMLIYTRHFVQTVSDIIHVMIRGFKEKDYNLQVKIREPYKEDEIFKLAEEYNENYLPKKMKMHQEEKEKKSTVLSMDDLLDFGKK